jgi:hypothetical protein
MNDSHNDFDYEDFMRQYVEQEMRDGEYRLGALAALVNSPGWKVYQQAMRLLAETAFSKAEGMPQPHQSFVQIGRARAFALAASWPEQMVEQLRRELGLVGSDPQMR